MARQIAPATQDQANHLEAALDYLRKARPWLRGARCPKTLAKLESTIKSAEGARRHMSHRIRRSA